MGTVPTSEGCSAGLAPGTARSPSACTSLSLALVNPFTTQKRLGRRWGGEWPSPSRVVTPGVPLCVPPGPSWCWGHSQEWSLKSSLTV